jgi:hypothetical protein
MNLPNILTLIRVLLIPVFVLLIINKLFEWALFTFAIAGITDGIDGLIARITHQRTELGAYLDPIADKLLLFSAFISLVIIGRFSCDVSHQLSSQDQSKSFEQVDHCLANRHDPSCLNGRVLPSLKTALHDRYLWNCCNNYSLRISLHLCGHSNLKSKKVSIPH